MRVTAYSPSVHPVAVVQKLGPTRHRDDPPRQKSLITAVVAPLSASAAFLAQLIAQEMLPPVEPALEGLNFRAVA